MGLFAAVIVTRVGLRSVNLSRAAEWCTTRSTALLAGRHVASRRGRILRSDLRAKRNNRNTVSQVLRVI